MTIPITNIITHIKFQYLVGNMAMQVVIDGNQIRQSNKQSDDRATNKWE